MKFEDYLAQELPFAKLLAAYIKPDNMKTIFEIGACEGEDTIKLSRTYKNATVYAFEPLPENVELVRNNVKKYKAERVRLSDLALSNKAGKATFFVSSGRPKDLPDDPEWDYGNKSSSLLKPNAKKQPDWLKFKEEVSVTTERLNTFCEKNGVTDIDFMYIDVQGAELMVLEGAGDMLSRTQAIWLEVEAVEQYRDQPLKRQVENFMNTAGFSRVMDTVDNVSGDQLYINRRILKAIAQASPRMSILLEAQPDNSYLGQAIESVLSQTVAEFELLITQDTLHKINNDITKKYTDPRIKFVSSIEQGQKQARGELLLWIQPDAFAYPHCIGDQLDYFNQHSDLGALCADFDVLGDIKNLPTNPFSLGGLAIRKRLLDKLSGQKAGESMASIAEGAPIGYIPKKLYGQYAPTTNSHYDDISDAFIPSNLALWLQVVATSPRGYQGESHYSALPTEPQNRDQLASTLHGCRELLELMNRAWYKLEGNPYRPLLERTLAGINVRFSELETQYYGPLPVSVVMGVYNGAEYVQSAIQSILDQSFKDFEFIIIDDGSSDDTAKIIQSFKDERIRLIPQSNHGLVYSLNQGITFARGKYIARQDADDVSLPNRFEKEVDLLLSNPKLGVVGGFFAYIDEKTSKPTGTVITSLTKSIDLKRTLYIVNPFAHGSTMFRKTAVQNAGGYRDIYGPTEDYDLWCRIAEDWDLAQVPEVLYQYRLNTNGISHQNNTVQNKFAAEISKKQWEKPFVRKGFSQIISDAHYYKSMNSEFADRLYHQYIHEQALITKSLLAQNRVKTGTLSALATMWLDKNTMKSLARPIIGSTLRKLRLRDIPDKIARRIGYKKSTAKARVK